MLHIFAILDDASVMNFRKKLQHNFPKMRGGGSKAVWNFSENSSVLEGVSVPKGQQYFTFRFKTLQNSWGASVVVVVVVEATVPVWKKSVDIVHICISAQKRSFSPKTNTVLDAL